jgi:hypothetical protein
MPAPAAATDSKSPTTRRREQELLLCCARVCADEATAARIRDLARDALDWNYLFKMAHRHSVLPLLFRQLSAHARAEVPPAQFRRLREQYRDNAARNLLLAGELTRIVKLFEAEGVRVVPYKGPVLAACAYGDLTLRTFVDLDILVRKLDVARAKELLIAQGFRPQVSLTPAQESVLLRTQHNLPFTREGGRLIVELHWGVVSERFAGSASGDEMWGRLIGVRLGGEEVKTLSPEDLLLALCVHGTKHLWERLAWIADVAELLNSHPGLDWPAVFEQARTLRTDRMLLLGLRLADELLAASMPDDIRLAARAEPGVAQLFETVRARLFKGAEYRPAGFIENIAFNLRARHTLGDRVRYFRFIFAPTDGDVGVLALPSGLSFLYYLLRPVRLLLKGSDGH